MEDKIPCMAIMWHEFDVDNKGCLNCRNYCKIRSDELEECFDTRECKRWLPGAEDFRISIFSEEEKDKILQFVKDNHYGEV